MRSSTRWASALCMAGALWASAAQASDRPFLITSSAAAEEDDDGVWAIESWWQRSKSQQGLSVAAEYGFNPTTSLQIERSRVQDRASGDKVHAVELELKHLFNRIGREGWGWGINVAVGAATVDETGWRTQRLSIKLPYTLALREGQAMLHINAGLQKQRDERREWVASTAFEHKLGARTTLFAEVGREDRSTLLHGGVRHWLKRDKFAVDFSVQQVRSGGSSERGVVLGFGWYDL
jgi:hypothetical protein